MNTADFGYFLDYAVAVYTSVYPNVGLPNQIWVPSALFLPENDRRVVGRHLDSPLEHEPVLSRSRKLYGDHAGPREAPRTHIVVEGLFRRL